MPGQRGILKLMSNFTEQGNRMRSMDFMALLLTDGVSGKIEQGVSV
jgi:hypothetical protein